MTSSQNPGRIFNVNYAILNLLLSQAQKIEKSNLAGTDIFCERRVLLLRNKRREREGGRERERMDRTSVGSVLWKCSSNVCKTQTCVGHGADRV